jgi:SAM-dependent methyltransferase
MARRHFHGSLIDIGCGTSPYKEALAPLVARYVGVDHDPQRAAHAAGNIVATAYEIPVADESFDCALSTSVLEHLEEPEVALRECHRVLKAGGVAIYSVPFIWHLHEEPRDFFRFSRYGLQHLFAKAGFEVLELEAICGFWGTFGQLLVYNLWRLNLGPLRWFRILSAVGLLVQGCALLLDRLDRTEQWTSLYVVAARKR